MKARLLADDWPAAEREAQWALDEGADGAETPIGRYAGCLALLVLGKDGAAALLADSLASSDFPHEVAESLGAIARSDSEAYGDAVGRVLVSFETREDYLEGIPVADTVVVLQRLAVRRGIGSTLPESPLLPHEGTNG